MSSIDLLSRIAPVSDAEAAEVFGVAGRENLLDAITTLAPERARPARRRLRRPIVVALAVVLVVAATGATWALTHGSAQETTAVDCEINGVTSVIDSTSGDPAADCAAIWPAPVPKLQAYDNGLGGVSVLPASEKAPAGWTPIASQDVALIELQESLDDHVSGLASRCFDSAAATSFAQEQIDRLGFTGWTVNVRSGSGSCYGGFTEPTSKAVVLFPAGDQSGAANWPPHELAESVRPLTQQCLTLDAMTNDVEQRATALGMSQTVDGAGNYQLKTVADDTLTCATVTESVGGTTVVVIRGPK